MQPSENIFFVAFIQKSSAPLSRKKKHPFQGVFFFLSFCLTTFLLSVCGYIEFCFTRSAPSPCASLGTNPATLATSEQSALCSVFLQKTSACLLAPPLSQKVSLSFSSLDFLRFLFCFPRLLGFYPPLSAKQKRQAFCPSLVSGFVQQHFVGYNAINSPFVGFSLAV